jgi:hypothetical protein
MREGLTKADLSYQCQSCQELHERAPHGVCPICGSAVIVPLGWYQVSQAEWQDWLTRIYGGNKKKGQMSGPAALSTE